MSTTYLKWIAGAVLALLLVWGGTRLLPSGTDRMTTAFRFPVVYADSVDSVVVATRAETVIVARTGGRWTANGFPTSPTAVSTFFGALTVHTAPELVAQSPSSFTRLGVDSAGAHRVRVVRGPHTLLDLFVSEHGRDFQGAFVRRPGDTAVYAIGGELGTVARRRLGEWRDPTIVTVIPDSVREVSLERGRHRVVLRRGAAGWRFAGGAAADSSAVRSLLDRWRTVSASGFPIAMELDSTFRGRVARRAALRTGTGAVVALEFDSTSGGFWVRRAGTGRDSVYRLNSWEVDQLVPSDSVLRARHP